MECAPSRKGAVRLFGLILIASIAFVVAGCGSDSKVKNRKSATLADVTDFTATPGDGVVELEWFNPEDTGLAGVLILRLVGDEPNGPDDSDAIEVYDGTEELITDSGLTNGTKYYYAAYAHDSNANYSEGVTVSATPVAAGGGGEGGGGITANAAPVANAGPDQNVNTGSLVTLDGSASSDADFDTLAYVWGASPRGRRAAAPAFPAPQRSTRPSLPTWTVPTSYNWW